MRRRPSEGVRGGARALGRVLAAVVLTGLASARAAAQQDVATEGALFLLLPVGARAVGMGQATMASTDGSEAVWWNPAGLARQAKRELAVHHSEPFPETTQDVVAFIVPSSLLGVVAISFNLVNLGVLDEIDDNQNVVGRLFPRDVVLAGSYATSIGRRLNAGITYKVLQFRVDCSGRCQPPAGSVATTSAIDVGAQYDLTGIFPVALGVAVRHLGPPLQVNDNPQEDALPARVQLGARYRVTPLERRSKDLELAVTADVLDRLRVGRPTWRVGSEATWRQRASLRAGWVLDPAGDDTPAVGVGLRQGRLVIDVARTFGTLTEDAGADPTFLSLRFQF